MLKSIPLTFFLIFSLSFFEGNCSDNKITHGIDLSISANSFFNVIDVSCTRSLLYIIGIDRHFIKLGVHTQRYGIIGPEVGYMLRLSDKAKKHPIYLANNLRYFEYYQTAALPFGILKEKQLSQHTTLAGKKNVWINTLMFSWETTIIKKLNFIISGGYTMGIVNSVNFWSNEITDKLYHDINIRFSLNYLINY